MAQTQITYEKKEGNFGKLGNSRFETKDMNEVKDVINANAADVPNSILAALNAPVLTNVPTTDPSVAGAIWSDSGVLTLSAG
jgi:hypothetical protein